VPFRFEHSIEHYAGATYERKQDALINSWVIDKYVGRLIKKQRV